MIKSVKIKDNLFVNVLPIELPKDTKIIESEPSHQFLIFDRSGSMSYYLDDIVNYATDYCKNLPEGSTVSIGYFSGRGQYNLSVPYTLKKELNGLVSTLETYRDAIGLTNFIEILNKVNVEASKSSTKASLYFFTDGCHNDGGPRKDIEEALKEWTKYAQFTMIVGYGYIDRQMLTWMASITDGSFIHLDNFKNVNQTLAEFGTAVEDSSPSITVNISVKEDITPIAISGKAIVEYTMDKGTIQYRPSKKGYKGVFFTTKNEIAGAEAADPADIVVERGIRALAVSASQKNDADIALELLAFLGDKFLIQKMYNAITPDEFSAAEMLIRKSVFSTKDRYVEGVVKNFLPAADAFCVMDAISIITNDDGAKMHVQDADFEYTKIGRKTKQKDGARVQYPADMSVYCNSIVMNKERLNLGISTSVQGTVDLDPAQFTTGFTTADLIKHGIASPYKVTSFRTYTIIADGRLQTKKLVLSDLAKDTVKQLGPVITKRADGKYLVDLSALPLINKTYVKQTSGKELAKYVWQEKVIADKQSVINWYKKKAEEASGKIIQKDTTLSDEAAAFLSEKCFIKNGSYNPPVEVLAAEDQYDAYAFTIDIGGYSKASASDVIKKVDAGKNPTPREQIVAEAYNLYKADAKLSTTGDELLKVIADYQDKLKIEMAAVRKYIQLSKFAIILGNKGKIDEFSSRENMKLEVPVKSLAGADLKPTFEFNIETITVKI